MHSSGPETALQAALPTGAKHREPRQAPDRCSHQQGDAPRKSCKWPRPSWWFVAPRGVILTSSLVMITTKQQCDSHCAPENAFALTAAPLSIYVCVCTDYTDSTA